MNLMDLVATLKMDVSQFLSGSKSAASAMSEIDAATSRLSNSIKNAGKGDLEALTQAFQQLGIKGAAQLRQLDQEATAAFLEIKHSGIATATDIANAEAAQMKIRREYYQSLGIDVGKTTEEITKMNNELLAGAAKLGALGAGLTVAITRPLVELGENALKMSEQFRLAQTTFEALIGSGQKAKQFLEELKAFAASTPFEFPELLDASKRMMALGFSAEAVIPTMRAIGDTVAGLGGGKALIDRITLALGQMTTAGKVNAQDMRQLTEAGIGAWQILADKIGVSIPQAMEMAKKGMISSAEAVPAILEGMQAKFGGLMEAQMQTLTGRWSNVKDQISFVLADIGKALTPLASQLLSAVEPLIGTLKNIVQAFTELDPSIQAAIGGFVAIAAAIGPALAAFAGLQGAAAVVGSALGIEGGIGAVATALVPILGEVALAVGAVWAAWQLWQIPEVQQKVSALGDALKEMHQNVLTPMADFVAGVFVENWKGVKEAWAAVQSAAATLGGYISGAFTSAWKSLSGAIDEVAKKFNFSSVIDAVKSKIVEFFESLKQIPIMKDLIGNFSNAWDSVKTRMSEVTETGKKALENITSIGTETRNTTTQTKEFSGGIDAVRRSLADHKVSLNDATESTKAFKDATTELHNADRIYAELVTSTLTPAHLPLYQAIENVKTAKDNARTAANNLITADSNLRDAMSNSKTSAEQLQAAQNGLKKAEDAAKEASQQMKEAMKDLHTAQQDAQKSAKELDTQFNALQKSMGAFARSEAPATTEAIKGVLAAVQSMNSAIDETAQTKAYRAQLALKDMGIKPKEDLDALAAKSREDFDIVTNSGTASATEITRAWVKMMEDRKAALRQNGKDLSEEEQRALDGMKAKLDNKPTLADKWGDIYGGIRSATSQLGKDMVDVLFEGPESFADKAIASLKNIGKAVADHFVQPAMDAIGKFIATTITDLLSGKGLGGVLDSIKSIGKAISDVFSSGSSAASAAGGATSAGGAASGAGGIGSAASSGLTGLISAISGVVTAVTGIFGIFQNMHQETSLNAIEHNTRYSMMFLGEQGWDSIHGNTHDSKLLLENIRDWMQGAQYNTLRDISSSLDKKTSDLWYEIIGVKDKLTDVKDASAAVATNVGDGDLNKKATDIHLMLITISGSLDDIKKSSGEIKTNTGTISTSALETSIGTMDTNITTALGNIKTDMGNFFTNFNTNLTQALTPLSTSIGQINPNNAIQTAIANLQSAVTGAIYAVDPRSIMTTMSSQLSSLSMLASLPQLLSNIGHSTTTMTTTNTTQVIFNVNGSPSGGQPISATDLGIRLRGYGINI